MKLRGNRIKNKRVSNQLVSKTAAPAVTTELE